MRTIFIVTIAAIVAYALSILLEAGFATGANSSSYAGSYPNPGNGYPSPLFLPAIFRDFDNSATPTPTPTPSPTPTRTPTPVGAYPNP